MPTIAVIETPSIFGLTPTGVQEMPTALKAAGLLTALKAEHSGRVESAAVYNPQRDPHTALLNGDGIHEYSTRLANADTDVLDGFNHQSYRRAYL